MTTLTDPLLTVLNKNLDNIAHLLDIPEDVVEEATARYEAVASWLGEGDSPLAPYATELYPQGSFRLGTPIRPLGANDEFDIDLVCRLHIAKESTTQKDLKDLVGDRLKANEELKKIIEARRRCWQLHYPGRFHLDVLPAIPDADAPGVRAEAMAQRLLPAGGGVPRGVFLSIACAEAISLVNPATVAAETANTFLGDAGVRRLLRSCEQWPKGWLPTGFWDPVRSNVPVLLLTGALDNTTPSRYAEAVAGHLSNSRQIILPDRSHNDLDPCVSSLINAFLLSGETRDVDTGCLADGSGMRFATGR